jgi:hypothetical protein
MTKRGRPPKPDALTKAEVQRRYRERLRAQGKILRLVSADFTPAEMVAKIAEFRDSLHIALLKIELRDETIARLETRNRFLEAELIRLEREALNAAKDRIVARWPQLLE